MESRQDHAQELLAMVERQNLQPEGRQLKLGDEESVDF